MSFVVLVVDDEPDVEMPNAPGTRRHIKGALKAGATLEEIMEVSRLCIVRGAQACNLRVPILAEEIAAVPEAVARP
jgi:alkylhydroperoxidase/carboxymuconolactone decarboxylase family protein YurZ